jgi:hypothetical protein
MRQIELSERGRTLDQRSLGSPHSRELKFGLRDSTGALELDCDIRERRQLT